VSTPSDREMGLIKREEESEKRAQHLARVLSVVQILCTLVCKAARKRRFLRYQSYLLTDVCGFIIYFFWL